MDIWVALGLVLAVVGLVVSVYYGKRSVPPGEASAPRGPEIVLKVTNAFPVYNLPGGGQNLGDHHVTVEAVNVGDRMMTITGWGIRLPDDRSIVITRPVGWSTPLPHELRPGAVPVQLSMLAEDLRRIAREEGVSFDDMKPYVTLADGKKVLAIQGVPLA